MDPHQDPSGSSPLAVDNQNNNRHNVPSQKHGPSASSSYPSSNASSGSASVSASAFPPTAGLLRPVTAPAQAPAQAPAGLSFIQRRTHVRQPASTMATIVEGDTLMRPIDRPPPGDRLASKCTPESQKRRSTYYQTEFAATNRQSNPAKTRVHNEAIVMAELKTNVIIKDEFTFITDLSYHLSNRYQRPISSIVITINHGQCMMFGGSFDPAYTLAIHALPNLMRPTMNKRNAALVQRHMEESLGVHPERGFVRFVPTPEDNVALGGKTMTAELEELTANDDEGPPPSRSKSKSNRRISMKSLSNLKVLSPVTPATDAVPKLPTPPPSTSEEGAATAVGAQGPPTPPEEDRPVELPEMPTKPKKTASRRKSLRFSLFGGTKTLPPLPAEKPRPKTAGS